MFFCVLFFSMFSFINDLEKEVPFQNTQIEKEYNILEDEYLKNSNIRFEKRIEEETQVVQKTVEPKTEEIMNEVKINEVNIYCVSENSVSLDRRRIDEAVIIYVNGWLNENRPFESPDEILADFEIQTTTDNYNYTILRIIEECDKYGYGAEARELYQNCHIL